MLLPLGDTPNPRRFTPWVNYLLIAANVTVFVLVTLPLSGTAADPSDPRFAEYLRAVLPHLPRGVDPAALLASTSAYDLVVFEHGFKPGAPGLGDLFASMFLHAGVLHLAGNMLFLWIFGDNCEHRLGRPVYLAVYLLTGAAATLFFALFAGASMLPLVGASGAISGVLGLYFVLFPRNRVKTFVLLFPFFFNVVLLPARWVLAFYLVIDNLLPFFLGAQSGVAHGAHIGGFVAGFLVARGGERLAWQWPWAGRLRRGMEPSPEREGPADEGTTGRPLETVRLEMAAGDAPAALAAAARLDDRALDALAPRECAQLAAWMEDAGYPVAAARLLRRCLARRGALPDRAEASLQLGLLRLREGQAAAAYQHLLDALDADPSPETSARAREALERIEIYRRRRPAEHPPEAPGP